MFLVNSRHPHFSATSLGSKSEFFHLTEAHLLPKLRCQFAEFLNQSSLKRLRILSLPTCVGLRYGYSTISLRGFSRQHGINHFAKHKLLRHHASVFEMKVRICLDLALRTCPGDNHRPGLLTLPRHSIAGLLPAGSVGPEGLSLASWIRPGRACSSTGISTCYPSTTPLGLALGPD